MTDHAQAVGLLLEWYRLQERDLPWRRTQDPWAIWVSEIMLQQTRVEAVIPKWEAFLASYPRVEDFAAANKNQVLQSWEGLGYYRRVRMLHRAAQELTQAPPPQFPQTREQWMQLPGIGDYTSAALASIVNGEKVAVVDGNVKRVAARFLALEFRADQAELHRRAFSWAMGLHEHSTHPGDLNQALMDWGATVCLPKVPRCELCPLQSHCQGYRNGDPARWPLAAKRRTWKNLRIVFFLAQKEGEFFLEPSALGWTPGYWEPPGYLLPETADPVEFWASRGGQGQALELIGEFRHTITHHKIRAQVFDLQGVPEASFRKPSTVPLSSLGKKAIQCHLNHFNKMV